MKIPNKLKRSQQRHSVLPGLLMAAPALLAVVIFQIIPILYTIRLSVSEKAGFSVKGFVGLQNFARLISDRKFINLSHIPEAIPTGALVTSLQWMVFAVPTVILIGMIVALAADHARFQSIIRGAFFLPMVISGTVIGIVWLFVYTPNLRIGLLNAILKSSHSWLGDPKLVNASLMGAWIWSQTGMSVVIIAAALKGVPKDLLDAGKVDGANAWKRYWHITLPSIRIPLSFLLVTQLVQVLKVFDVVYVMTGGGPAGLSRTLALFFYQQTFEYMNPQYGAAIVVVMSLVIVIAFKITRKIGEGD